MDEVEALARQGAAGVAPLVSRLDDPSWAVRRGVVAALAQLGDVAVGPLCEVLVRGRDNEARIAAAVDALSASSGDAEGAVAGLVEHPDAAVVYDAAQVLGRRRSAEAAPLLARLTAHPDDNVAVAAIEALGRVGGGAAVDALIASATSGNFFRTFPAIDVLGRTGDARAVAPLVSLLESPVYALEAARALGRTGDERAVPPLVGLLSRAGEAHARVAATSLLEVHEAQVVRLGVSHAVAEALAAAGPALGRRLTRCLPGADVAERVALGRLLGWVGGGEAVAALIDLLDAEPPVAYAAARALGERTGASAGSAAAVDEGVEEQVRLALRSGESARRLVLLPLVGRKAAAVGDILACLEDRDPAVRALACETLARIGDVGAVEPLFARLADADARVAQAAQGAIQSLGSPRTEALALAAAGSPDTRVRRAALRIIAYFGYAKGLEPLLAAVDSEDERLRDAALFGLPFLEDPRALQALLQAARHAAPRTRASAMRALGQVSGEEQVTEVLRAGLKDADAWVRYYACQSLGRRGDAGAVDEVVALMDDEAGQVRVAAVEALAHLRTPAALAALRRAASAPDADLQRAALLGLGAQRQVDSLPALLSALDAPDAATRLVAVSALAAFGGNAPGGGGGPPEVLPALGRAAHDPDESVRTAALGFLAAREEPAATALLVGLLAHPAARAAALSALAQPVPGRIAGLQAGLESADEEVAPLVVAALARMGRADATAALVDTLKGGHAHSRRAAASALAQLGPAAHAALASAAEEDPDPEVRRLCTEALGR
nr:MULTISPECIES: HEAT repeat domain-containing protein [Myxococcaceae]